MSLAIAIAHPLLLAALAIAGALLPIHLLRGRLVEMLAVAGEAAILWYTGRMLVGGMGDRHVAEISYAPFVGASIGFVGLVIGQALYDRLAPAGLLDDLPVRLRGALTWMFGPGPDSNPSREG